MQKIKKIFSKKITFLITCIVAVLFSTFYIYFVERPIAVGMEYRDDYYIIDGDLYSVVFKATSGKKITMTITNVEGEFALERSSYYSTYYYIIDGHLFLAEDLEVNSYTALKAKAKEINKTLSSEEKKQLLFKVNAFTLSFHPTEAVTLIAICSGQIGWTVILGVLELAILTITGYTIFLNVKKKKQLNIELIKKGDKKLSI